MARVAAGVVISALNDAQGPHELRVVAWQALRGSRLSHLKPSLSVSQTNISVL